MKRFLGLTGLFAVLCVITCGCQKVQGPEMPETGEIKPMVSGTQGEQAEAEEAIAMATIVVNETPFAVEMAVTDDQKAKGLMNRESLPENNGMWFVFEHPVQEKFWMKDTTIPLDLIFVNEEMKVVHIIENAVPLSTEMLSSPVPYTYVLEVNAGSVEKHGIKEGDAVEKRIGTK